MPNFTGVLAGLSGLPQGIMQAQQFEDQRAYQQVLLAMAAQRQKDQQQAQAAQALGFAALARGMPQGVPGLPSGGFFGDQGGMPPQGAPPSPASAVAPPGGMPPTPGGVPFPTKGNPMPPAPVFQLGTPQDQTAAAAIPPPAGPSPGMPGSPTIGAPQGAPVHPVAQMLGGAPAAAAAAPLAKSAVAQIPPAAYGSVSLPALAQSIDKLAPEGTPDNVKFLALASVSQLLAPGEKEQLALAIATMRQQSADAYHNAELGLGGARIGLEGERLGIEGERLKLAEGQAAQGKGWQFVTGPDGQIYRASPSTGKVEPANLPSGSVKFGASAPVPMTDSDINFWANVVRNGGALPPGLSRTGAGSMVVQKIMAKIPGLSQQDPGAFIANASAVKANSHSLMNMTKMADAATSFERTAKENFDLALKLSAGAVPTNWGPWLNKWIETGETQAGNKEVPAYVAAMLTAANEYAKIMSGSTGAQGSTVDSRREAAELFSPYLAKGQIEAVVKVAENDMANRKASLYGQVQAIQDRLHSAGTPGSTAAPGGGGPPTITTKEQYDALPPGSPYMWNGKAGTKQ